jgi:hypothetical protein
MLMSRAAASARGPRRSLPPRRSAALLTAVAVGALALGGCQTNPAPPPLERTSISPTLSPSPTIAAPTLPAEAQGTSEAAAKAFVRHYFDALNHAMNTGEVEHLRGLGAENCASCATIAGNIDATYAAGGKISSRGWSLRSVTVVPGQPSQAPILDLGVMLTRERVVERAGAEPRTFEGGKQPMTIHLVRQDNEWRVSRLDRVG